MACTKSGDPCDFPFSYKDTMYNECTSRDSNKPWCETNAQTDDWGYCAECPSSEYYTIEYCQSVGQLAERGLLRKFNFGYVNGISHYGFIVYVIET